MFEKVIEAVRQYDTIIIHRHSFPDGDALGSQIGLYELLKENFPGKTIYKVGDEPRRYSFMNGSVMDVIDDECYAGALAFLLDSATEELVSDKRFRLAEKSVRIDHHIYCETFTDIEIVDTSFESCCGMIAELSLECSLTLTPKAATAIFTGIHGFRTLPLRQYERAHFRARVVSRFSRRRFELCLFRTLRVRSFDRQDPRSFHIKDLRI